MDLRRATLADIPMLEDWDRQPHVIACYGADSGDWPWAEEIAKQGDYQEIFIGLDAGRPVGVVVIIDPAREPSHYWGDVGDGLRAIDIWLGAATDLGRGLGGQLMRQAIDHCFSDDRVDAILIDPLKSNHAARRFYRRLGFVEEGERVFEVETCLVHRLTRSAWHAAAAPGSEQLDRA